MLRRGHTIYCRRYIFTIKKKFLSVFTFCQLFIFLLFILQSPVTSEDFKNSTVYESDANYTFYKTFDNDSDQNITMSNENMNDSDFNKSLLNNVSFDVATELESTISVTEDSDNSLQSETNKELFLFLTPDEDICNCDLSVSVCDINCCCDPDCSEEDVQIFSECSHQVLTPDENYCYQKNIILRNNTVYKMVKDPKSAMFCIVHDNFKHHLRFKDMPVLKSHRDVITVLKYKYKNTYSWDAESENIYDSQEPRAGNPIYVDIMSNKKIINSPWSLPAACLSDMCSCHEQVRYLTNFKSSCSHIIQDLGLECESNEILSGDPFANFCISQHGGASLTNLVIHAKMANSNSSEDDEYYSSLPKRICVKNPEKPRRGSDKCENVVKHVHFTVEQNGGDGITGVSVDFRYDSVPLGKRVVIGQSYSVEFVWSNETRYERKSGNPGYQVGLPVLAATNGSDLDSEETSKVFDEDGLTVLSGDGGGLCAESRQTVRFGKNLRSGCVLRHDFTDCKSVRRRVSDILLGPNKRHTFVGIFGNANISSPNDWIEIFHGAETGPSDDPDCLVSLGLKIHILYAAVGTFANPQNKIVGVRYLYSRAEPIDSNRIVLKTSVSFFDVTLPAVQHYAKVPSIKANLPSDFFYPFLYGQSAENRSNGYLILIVLCICYSLIK